MTAPRAIAPATEDVLTARAADLAGRSLGWIAARLQRVPPPDLRMAKGWVGHLVEAALGATAGSRAVPDFPHLGVELKTIPVDGAGAPRESTWVCTAPLDGRFAASWATSHVRAKLARVLWVPVVGRSDRPVAERTIGTPRLWSPDPDEERTLRDDWEALTELLALGELWQVTAHLGDALQLRPKAASSRDLKWVVGDDGDWVRENPRGFYLRRSFTASVLAKTR